MCRGENAGFGGGVSKTWGLPLAGLSFTCCKMVITVPYPGLLSGVKEPCVESTQHRACPLSGSSF